MPEYQLEIKQVVDYPRCRIYRQLIQTLIEDRSIRASGGSGLFYFAVLCSYANFRTSYRRLEGINYTIYPGEWLCRVDEIQQWFRCRFKYQAISELEKLQDKHLIHFTILGRGALVKFWIRGWRKFNTILEYNAPCQKDKGFFFLPITTATDLVSAEKCSEMDIVLDLWINTIYNDEQVASSDIGPVVYMRNGTGSPLVGYSELAARWGISKATASRIIKKLERMKFLTIHSFPGRHGSAIYLCSFLSTMFSISDVMVDKEEVAMALSIKVAVPDGLDDEDLILEIDDQFSVSSMDICVSKSHIRIIVSKVAEMLSTQGLACCHCRRTRYMLYPLSPDCWKPKYHHLSLDSVDKNYVTAD